MAPFSKLGGHLRANTSAGQTWARNCQIVKSLDLPQIFDVAPPGTITVHRHYMGNGDGQYRNQSGTAAAQAVIGSLGGRRPTYIEGANECGYGDVAGYAAWMAEFTAYAHSQGYQVAGFSYGTGWPQPSDWAYLRSVGFSGVDVVALHCYTGLQGFTQNNALRFQQLWQPGDPPIVVTETGIDAVEGAQPGYQANGLSAQQFVSNFCIPYDQIITPIPYVIGAVVFTNGGCPDFCPFEIDSLVPVIWPGGSGPPPCGGQGQPCCTSGAACLSGYDCIGGVCQVHQGPLLCQDDSFCVSLFGVGWTCDPSSGLCQPPVTPGSVSLDPAVIIGSLLVIGAVGGVLIASGHRK